MLEYTAINLFLINMLTYNKSQISIKKECDPKYKKTNILIDYLILIFIIVCVVFKYYFAIYFTIKIIWSPIKMHFLEFSFSCLQLC